MVPTSVLAWLASQQAGFFVGKMRTMRQRPAIAPGTACAQAATPKSAKLARKTTSFVRNDNASDEECDSQSR